MSGRSRTPLLQAGSTFPGGPLASAKMKTVALLLLLAFAMPNIALAQTTEVEVIADPAVYGEYPKNYQEIITNWLATVLADPASANIEWVSAPKPADVTDKKKKKRFVGYQVDFKVNSRNRFGAYTGMQKKNVIIRDGKVIKATGFGFGIR